jgi:hypothetical protein
MVQQPQAGDRGRERERDRHVEAPAPVEQLRQRAAQQQADGAAHAGDPGVDAEGLPPLGGVGEGRGQEGEGRRGEHCAEATLKCAGRNEEVEALGRPAEGRRAREADQAGDERPLAAEEVGDAAAEQEQAAEGEGVRRDHPLAVVVREAEVLLSGRKRDVHDRHVEHDHQLGDADHGQDQPASVVVGGCGGVGS